VKNNIEYDFVLFENHFWSYHHYIDLMNIAKMLDYNGFSVAIANYADENVYCKNDKFPIIEIPNRYKRPNRNFCIHPKNKINSFLLRFFFEFQQFRYSIYFLKQIKGLSKNFYAGSFSLELSLAFVIFSKFECNFFFWGLRSYNLTNFGHHLVENPVIGMKAILFNLFFKKKKNLNFFVSNEFIKEEFIKLGINSNKIIIRAERTIDKLPGLNLNKLSDNFNILTIGLIRRDKRLEFSLNAFNLLNNPDMTFTIAGRNAQEKYEDELLKIINDKNNIIRKNYFLERDEFNKLIEGCHFLVLCDKEQLSTVTNGTMMEALLLNRPIIVPDYLPYNYYVKKYGIGYLFNPTDLSSLIAQIKHAKETGVESFLPLLQEFQKTLLFDISAKKFNQEIKHVLTV